MTSKSFVKMGIKILSIIIAAIFGASCFLCVQIYSFSFCHLSIIAAFFCVCRVSPFSSMTVSGDFVMITLSYCEFVIFLFA